MDRPYVARELVPWGGDATTNLLIALDRRVQDRLLDPNAIAPIARLMGVGDVLLRLDLQTDQFSLVSARGLWEDFTKHGVPAGLDAPTTYGTKIPGKLLGTDVGDPAEPPQPEPKPVAVFPVRDPQTIIRAHPAAAPLVVDGDGEGLVDAAGVGLLPDSRLVVSSAQYDDSPKALRAHVPAGSVLLVTDTNRRQGMRWAGMRNNYGYTEQAGEQPLRSDLLDQRLEVYPGRHRPRPHGRGAARDEVGAGHHLRHAGLRLHPGRPAEQCVRRRPQVAHGKWPRGSRRSVGSDSSPSSSTR